MRRLTRFEYTNTVRSLLQLELAPGARFVPDEKAGWFENDASALTLSPVLAEQYLSSAEDLAARFVAALEKALPCATRGDDACAATFIADMGQRAFRRPLAPEETTTLQAAYAAAKREGGFKPAIEVVLRLMLVSPPFLYRAEVGEPLPGRPGVLRPTSWEMASRLSYTLWGTMPDAVLFAAAQKNELVTADAVRAHAERMLMDPLARPAVARIFQQWMSLEQMDELDKLIAVFPDWSPALGPLMRKEVEAYLVDAFWGTPGTFAALYTGTRTFINADLGKLYGTGAPAGTTLQAVQLDATRRAGLMTLAGVLAAHASNDSTSPTLRGAFVRTRVLCGDLPPPPPNVNNQRPPASPATTTRERADQHARDPACSGCHAVIDPIGYGFERYDGIGKYRTMESGKAIDDAGEVSGTSIGKFSGALDLARKVAASPEAARCYAEQLYRAALGRRVGVADASALDAIGKVAADPAPGALKRALVAVLAADAFMLHTSPGGRP